MRWGGDTEEAGQANGVERSCRAAPECRRWVTPRHCASSSTRAAHSHRKQNHCSEA